MKRRLLLFIILYLSGCSLDYEIVLTSDRMSIDSDGKDQANLTVTQVFANQSNVILQPGQYTLYLNQQNFSGSRFSTNHEMIVEFQAVYRKKRSNSLTVAAYHRIRPGDVYCLVRDGLVRWMCFYEGLFTISLTETSRYSAGNTELKAQILSENEPARVILNESGVYGVYSEIIPTDLNKKQVQLKFMNFQGGDDSQQILIYDGMGYTIKYYHPELMKEDEVRFTKWSGDYHQIFR